MFLGYDTPHTKPKARIRYLVPCGIYIHWREVVVVNGLKLP